MTLAKAVRHRVHSIASRGCVHRSMLPPSQSVLLSFLYEAVFILQLSVCFTFRISGCRKPTSVAALISTMPRAGSMGSMSVQVCWCRIFPSDCWNFPLLLEWGRTGPPTTSLASKCSVHVINCEHLSQCSNVITGHQYSFRIELTHLLC